MPALRDRQEDIPLLIRHFAGEFSHRMNKTIETISPATMEALQRYAWPGNIRELQNVIERAVILSPGPALIVALAEINRLGTPEPVGETRAAISKRRRPVRSILADVEQMLRALKEAEGRVGGLNGAAARLGLKRTTFITRMKKLGINGNAAADEEKTSRDISEARDTFRALLAPLDASSAE